MPTRGAAGRMYLRRLPDPSMVSDPVTLACINPVIRVWLSEQFLHATRARTSADERGTGFYDDSVSHGPIAPYTSARRSSSLGLMSISPPFRPKNSLFRNPVVAARSTSVRSRIAKPLSNALISAGVRIIATRGVARAPNRAIAPGTHRLQPPTTGWQ